MPGGAEARLARVSELVDALLLDLAMLMAGRRPRLDSLAPSLARTVRDGLAPFLEGGFRLDPDFGDRASADVEGVQGPGPVDVKLVIHDRSVVVHPDASRGAPLEGHWHLEIRIAPDLAFVTDLAIAAAPVPAAGR